MSALILAARRYLGARFVHRGRLPHKLDCVGLIWIAYRDCGVDLEDVRVYGREPDLRAWREAMERNLGPAVLTGPLRRDTGLQVGDVVSMRTLSHPHHLAFIADHPDGLGLIHASGMHGRVVWHRLDPSYRARIVTVHRRPV